MIVLFNVSKKIKIIVLSILAILMTLDQHIVLANNISGNNSGSAIVRNAQGWSYNCNTHTLTIYNDDAMECGVPIPFHPFIMPYWWQYKSEIQKLIIESGVTKVKFAIFEEYEKLNYIEISSSVREIEDYAFAGCISLTEIKVPEYTIISPTAFDDTNIRIIRMTN